MSYEKSEVQSEDYASVLLLSTHNVGAGGVDQYGCVEIPTWSLITESNQANRNKRFKQMLIRSDRAVGAQPL